MATTFYGSLSGSLFVTKKEYDELQKELDSVKETLLRVTNERDSYYDHWYEADDKRFFWKAAATVLAGITVFMGFGIYFDFFRSDPSVKEEPVNYAIKLDDSELRY